MGGIGMLMVGPTYCSAAWDPHTPASSDRALSLTAGLGWVIILVGGWQNFCNFSLASVFQMAYSLNQSKAKEWTRRLSQLSLVGYLHGGGFLIVYSGSHFAHDQQSSDTAVAVGITCVAIALSIIAFLILYACFELRALQKTVSPDSSTGKTLKQIYPILGVLGIMALNGCLSFSLIPVVPWLRDRAGTIVLLIWLPVTPAFVFLCLHDLQQLRKRQAAKKQLRQIMPASSNNITDTHNGAARTSTVADTIAATSYTTSIAER
jgi:hypothetical protein